jgi:hypothetical protein
LALEEFIDCGFRELVWRLIDKALPRSSSSIEEQKHLLGDGLTFFPGSNVFAHFRPL